jgi:hypothetical protein
MFSPRRSQIVRRQGRQTKFPVNDDEFRSPPKSVLLIVRMVLHQRTIGAAVDDEAMVPRDAVNGRVVVGTLPSRNDVSARDDDRTDGVGDKGDGQSHFAATGEPNLLAVNACLDDHGVAGLNELSGSVDSLERSFCRPWVFVGRIGMAMIHDIHGAHPFG